MSEHLADKHEQGVGRPLSSDAGTSYRNAIRRAWPRRDLKPELEVAVLEWLRFMAHKHTVSAIALQQIILKAGILMVRAWSQGADADWFMEQVTMLFA